MARLTLALSGRLQALQARGRRKLSDATAARQRPTFHGPLERAVRARGSTRKETILLPCATLARVGARLNLERRSHSPNLRPRMLPWLWRRKITDPSRLSGNEV